MSALGRDFQYAVSSLRTIEGGTVSEDFYTFDVFGIDEVEDIVIETVVQRGATVLHIPNDSVDNDKRLRIGVELSLIHMAAPWAGSPPRLMVRTAALRLFSISVSGETLLDSTGAYFALLRIVVPS